MTTRIFLKLNTDKIRKGIKNIIFFSKKDKIKKGTKEVSTNYKYVAEINVPFLIKSFKNKIYIELEKLI